MLFQRGRNDNGAIQKTICAPYDKRNLGHAGLYGAFGSHISRQTGYFPDRNIDTEFYALNEGLKTIRGKVGDEKYEKLVALSNRMRALFEADPEDETQDGIKGREWKRY